MTQLPVAPTAIAVGAADPVAIVVALVIAIPAAIIIVYVLTAKRELTKLAKHIRGRDNG